MGNLKKVRNTKETCLLLPNNELGLYACFATDNKYSTITIQYFTRPTYSIFISD